MNDEQNILNHYNLTNAFPTTWPEEKDDSDDSEEEKAAKKGIRRSKSRYSALERSGSDGRRSLVPGSQKLRDGQEALVQKDEADPLGASDSVVRGLRQRGLPVEEDSRLRNRFLLSSTTFSPNLYLSQVHSGASSLQLLHGLEFLSRSIDQKSASLKVLVESNFERFVRAKTTIDNVYAEMRSQGAEPEPDKSPRTHHRGASRGSTHYRNISGQGPKIPEKGIHKPLPSDKKKNALIKDSEYGVQGIKAPLIEVAVKAEEIWGPALGGRERENNLKAVLDSVERAHYVLQVDQAISECIKRKDYDRLVEEYTRARKYTEEARNIAGNATRDRIRLTDSQIHRIVIIGRMWTEVEDRISNFKRDVWHRLTNVHNNSLASQGKAAPDDHMALISILLELGTEDNPIWIWLLSRYDYLKTKIVATFERSRVEIEVLRRRLANADPPNVQTAVVYLKCPGGKDSLEARRDTDTPSVVELWDLIYTAMHNLLSIRGGVLGEVLEFWDRTQNFIDGKAQKTLPTGIDGRSREHHRFSQHGVKTLQKGAAELVSMLQDDVFSFFAEPPIEDISALYSPLPDTPNSPTPVTPQSATLSPFAHQDSRFKFDRNHPAPASPRRGESWEEFAFWPPYANSLGGVQYLEKLLTLVGSSAGEMLAMRPVASGNSLSDKLRTLVTVTRERCTRAVCAAWGRDAEMCKNLEDWSKASDQPELTNMPSRLSVLESTVLAGMQKVLYIPEAAVPKSGSGGIVSPPPAKLVQMVKSQFITSLYKALSGMVENAERSKPDSNNAEVSEVGDLSTLGSDKGSIDGNSKNIRKLLTLSNLAALQNNVVPSLISQFEINFSLPLTEESKTIRDALSQISDRLFSSYTQPTANRLSKIVHDGISASDWLPSTARPSTVRPYVYEALLLLVHVHTEVSTTAPQLTNQVLSHLLEQLSSAFLSAFKQRSRYPLAGLMQATLDVEFVAQTMSQYTTKKASDIQSEIYIQLDQGTTPDASKKLQGELPEMRQVLKRLREGTKSEFLCFKREKRVQS
ncbi:Exocyst complex component S5 [Lecanora helva]